MVKCIKNLISSRGYSGFGYNRFSSPGLSDQTFENLLFLKQNWDKFELAIQNNIITLLK